MGFIRVSVGDRVAAGGCEAVVTHIVSAEQAIVRDLTGGAVRQVPIRTLRPAPTAPEPRLQIIDLSLVGDEDWAAAQMRYEAVKPLLAAPRIDHKVLMEVAASTGRHQATIYRWLRRYQQEGRQTALIPAKRGVQPGHRRLRPEAETIVSAAIEERYLTPNRLNAAQLHRDVALNAVRLDFRRRT